MADDLFTAIGVEAPPVAAGAGADRAGATGDALPTDAPLAARMRPRTADEVVGQDHLLAPGRPLRAAIDAGAPQALLLHGPPGTGKTTIARIVADAAGAEVETLSAVDAGKPEVRAAIERARDRRSRGGATVLFIDEVHRFTRPQQDALLPAVEDGTITLVAATTEPPYASVSPALRSRVRVHRLRALEDADLRVLLVRALEREALGAAVSADEDALDLLALRSAGDARTALGALEQAALLARAGLAALLDEDPDADAVAGPRSTPDAPAVDEPGGAFRAGDGGAGEDTGPDASEPGAAARGGLDAADGGRAADGRAADPGGAAALPGGTQDGRSSDGEGGDEAPPTDRAGSGAPTSRPARRPVRITAATAARAMDRVTVVGGPDQPHDLLSAYIKSIRGSDPDAAIYWLAAMLESGEDPRVVARRLVVSASEDVGLADPLALPVAVAAAEVVDRIGMPECRIALGHATVRLALAGKSAAAYAAIDAAIGHVREHGVAEPPAHLKGRLSPGADPAAYDYPHTNPGGYSDQALLPEGLEGTRFLRPRAHETTLLERLAAARTGRGREP